MVAAREPPLWVSAWCRLVELFNNAMPPANLHNFKFYVKKQTCRPLKTEVKINNI
jgi:hypothetical protein